MKTEKITGIKSVDFKIVALGHGVVNWNGPTALKVQEDSKLGKNNHTLPKLRGYTNFNGKTTEKGFKEYKEPTDIDFKKNPLYISQNCIRHHLFREQAFDLHYATKKNIKMVIASLTGLVRGFVVPASQNKRTSPLLIEDFVDQLGNGNFEQFGQVGERDSSSFYSKTTFGDTQYLAYGSISIEQLQFISLDKKFDRASMELNEGEGEKVAQMVQEYISSLDTSKYVEVTFHENYVRNGTIFKEGEMGLLLNQDAIEILINETLDKINNLAIRQAKSYMYVDEIVVDYNDSNKMMRIKRDESSISKTKNSDYAMYFYSKEK